MWFNLMWFNLSLYLKTPTLVETGVWEARFHAVPALALKRDLPSYDDSPKSLAALIGATAPNSGGMQPIGGLPRQMQ